jgi:crossover junction endodeoxyribonuclease RusA
MISFTVSMPPSTNNLYANKPGGGRFKTKAYAEWIAANEYLVALAAKDGRKIAGPYALVVSIGKPDKRKRDIANCLKALEDLLVSVGAVRDDSDCQRIKIEWSEHVDDCFVQVMETQPVPVRQRKAA